MSGFNYQKSIQALNFFTGGAGKKQNKMKALKLIWLADRLHLRQYGRTITGDEYFALKNGPVASTTRDVLEQYIHPTLGSYSEEFISSISKYDYISNKEVDNEVFSETDLQTMQVILEKYGNLSEWDLSDLSHLFPEWKKYEKVLRSRGGSHKMQLEDFFINFDDGVKLFVDDEDHLKISKEMFDHYSRINEFM